LYNSIKTALVFFFASVLVLTSCTDTAATYQEVLEIRKLAPSFTHHERDDVSGWPGQFDVTYSVYLDDHEIKRMKTSASKADTIVINDYYFDDGTGIYFNHYLVANRTDTLEDCTYFFHRGACIKTVCYQESGELTDEEAEMAIQATYNALTQWIESEPQRNR